MRPAKGPLTGAGPIGVHLLALKVTDGEVPLSTRSTRRTTISKMEMEKKIQLLGLGIKLIGSIFRLEFLAVPPLSFALPRDGTPLNIVHIQFPYTLPPIT